MIPQVQFGLIDLSVYGERTRQSVEYPKQAFDIAQQEEAKPEVKASLAELEPFRLVYKTARLKIRDVFHLLSQGQQDALKQLAFMANLDSTFLQDSVEIQMRQPDEDDLPVGDYVTLATVAAEPHQNMMKQEEVAKLWKSAINTAKKHYANLQELGVI